MAGYEYEDETEKVTWSIVNDIKQVTEDIISSIIGSIQQVSFKTWASVCGEQDLYISFNVLFIFLSNLTQECMRRDNYVSDELATFTLKLVYQDPKNGYEEGQPLDKLGIDRLTELCLQKILEDHGPLMETVRMQVCDD